MNSSSFVWALALLASASSVGAANFINERIDEDSQAIVITGEIERGDDEIFRQLTIQFPDAWVVLDSPGGALTPALEIGRLIRLRGYTTVVLDGDTCTSSCALMWLAGEGRIIQGAGNVGFHASYIDETGTKVESGVGNAIVGHYLSQLGLSQRAVIFATMAPPDKVAWLTSTGKRDAGIDFTAMPLSTNEVASSDSAPTPPPIQTSPIARSPSTAEYLRAQFRAPGVAEAGARAIGATGALLGPLSEHIRLIYAHDSVIELAAREIDAARINVGKDPQAGGVLLFRLSNSLIMKGMRRLPQRDVNQYIGYMSALAITADANCSTFEDTGKASTREAEAIARLGGNHLEIYLAITRKAMFAEADGFPAPISLDARQTEIAENAWAEVLVAALEKRGQSEAARLLSIMESYDKAQPIEQCEANKLMLPAIAGMSGMAGDWFRRVYLDYVIDAF